MKNSKAEIIFCPSVKPSSILTSAYPETPYLYFFVILAKAGIQCFSAVSNHGSPQSTLGCAGMTVVSGWALTSLK